MTEPQHIPDRETIRGAVAARRDWAARTLRGLVRHPSTLGHERSAQEELAGALEDLDLEVRFEPVAVERIRDLPGFSPVDWTYEDRPNLVGLHHAGGTAGRSLILNGHIDVVSPEPTKLWSFDPFEPEIIEDGAGGETWITGRGAGDMKGGTVCGLWALAALRELGLEPASPLIVESPIEEECTGNGTLALCERGYTADGVIIPEPFEETILVRQVGVMWFQVRVLGRTTHVLGAGRGVNAIEKSWPIIRALRALEEERNRPERIPEGFREVEHPVNLNVGIINGGDWASTVAGECVTRFRIGLFPGEELGALRRTVEARVAEAAEADPWLRQTQPTVEYVGFQAEGCELEPGSPLADELSQAHRAWRGRDPEPLSATATTDVRFFNLYQGVPATCYGPKVADIHGVDEMVSLDSMERVAEVLISFIGRWCGLQKRREMPRR